LRGCALHATQVWIQSGLRESLSPQIAASKMQSWRSLSSTVACGSIRCGPASRCMYFVQYKYPLLVGHGKTWHGALQYSFIRYRGPGFENHGSRLHKFIDFIASDLLVASY
jgi:hypothetical protein